jgi:hypothetical protein
MVKSSCFTMFAGLSTGPWISPTQHMKSKWVEIFRGKAAVGRRITISGHPPKTMV